jgi:hypothetical protein
VISFCTQIDTYTGRRFSPFIPEPADIAIEDIAHALSLQCRFGGHIRVHFSVAQHSELASWLVPAADALWALLHDASEAYLVDIPRPLKQSPWFTPYREAEAALQRAIFKRFGLRGELPAAVTVVDDRLLATEARDLLIRDHDAGPAWWQADQCFPFLIEPWEPRRAETQFLRRFRMLTGGVECVDVRREDA